MKKKTVHRLAAFMTACFLSAGDLGNSGYVMVSGEAVASETVSLQEEQAEGQAESTPVAGQEQSAETENKTDIQAENRTEQSEGLEQEADQE